MPPSSTQWPSPESETAMGNQLSPEVDQLTRRLERHAEEIETLLMSGKNLPASAQECAQRARDLRVTVKLVRNFLLISHGLQQHQAQTCTLKGVRTDGTEQELGTIPVPPAMKLKEIMRQYFTGEAEDQDSDLALAIAAGTEFMNWLNAQGWGMRPAEQAFAASRT